MTHNVVTDTLFLHVRADDNSSTDEPTPEVKYAAIGIGIGVFLSICFIAVKLCMIKRHMFDNEPSDESVRRSFTQQK
ncbi:hypothetical protein P4O66_011199 [Electrophorus voltai]|uniref:Transmembrane protein 273 n=1 Tax=Electrophorus voltai TaxID=2609070 RepID=A0AAD8ZAM8_9TELE|nr:hypothetical protein P4O66_011199 [Electrophorus voltai]